MRKLLTVSTLVLIILLVQVAPSYALTCTAQASGDWDSAATWSGCGGGPPGPNDDVVIPAPYNVSTNSFSFPIIRGVGTTTRIENGGILLNSSTFVSLGTVINRGTISANSNFSISGGVLNNFGTITSNLELVNSGTINNYGTISTTRFLNWRGVINNICMGIITGAPVDNSFGGIVNTLPCSATTTSTSSGSAIDPSTIPPDDRLNYGRGDKSVGIGYARSNNGITVYGINPDSTGYLAVHVAPENLPSCDMPPTENQLLASSGDGKYTIWLLTTCEYQINMGPDAEGKVFVMTWQGVPLIKESIKYYDFNMFDVLGG